VGLGSGHIYVREYWRWLSHIQAKRKQGRIVLLSGPLGKIKGRSIKVGETLRRPSVKEGK
jgi:hypothetical protein